MVAIILCILAFTIRVLAVKISIKKSIPLLDISIASVMVPKGLAAVVLATIPLQQQIVGGETIRNITYGVIFISIVMTSLLILLIEKTKVSDLYGWILSPRFPRLRPRIVARPKDIAGDTDYIVPSGTKLFKGTGDTSEKPPNGEN